MDRPAVAIEIRDLRKIYGDKAAVDGLTLSVPQGCFFGFLGPNGAGKTTTIEVLEGLTRPDGGDIEILGMHWDTHERALRDRLGISLHETQLNEKLTVAETVTSSSG